MLLRKIWEENEKERPREKLLIKREEAETIGLGYVSLKKGEKTQVGFHEDEEEIYVILDGEGYLELGEEMTDVVKGDVIYVPRNTHHRMTGLSEEKFEYLYMANWPK